MNFLVFSGKNFNLKIILNSISNFIFQSYLFQPCQIPGLKIFRGLKTCVIYVNKHRIYWPI